MIPAHCLPPLIRKIRVEFLKSAVEDMVRRWEIQELNTKMDEIAERIAKKIKLVISVILLSECARGLNLKKQDGKIRRYTMQWIC